MASLILLGRADEDRSLPARRVFLLHAGALVALIFLLLGEELRRYSGVSILELAKVPGELHMLHWMIARSTTMLLWIATGIGYLLRLR